MEPSSRAGKTRSVVKSGAKYTALIVALLVFIILLAFVLGVIFDRFFISPYRI
ncbi:MAG TPA: hypothetical protein VMT23_03855 [Candidatus Binatia bacterium]|nr:hypothetical protein [Candidatus Binatia bacterium]